MPIHIHRCCKTYRCKSIVHIKHICGYFSILCELIRKRQHCGMKKRANRNGFDMSTYCKLDTFFMYALPRPDIVWHQDSIKIGSSCRKTLISMIILNHWLLLISLSQFSLPRNYRASFKPPQYFAMLLSIFILIYPLIQKRVRGIFFLNMWLYFAFSTFSFLTLQPYHWFVIGFHYWLQFVLLRDASKLPIKIVFTPQQLSNIKKENKLCIFWRKIKTLVYYFDWTIDCRGNFYYSGAFWD